MKYLTSLIIILVLLFTLIACEDVITIEPSETQNEWVVDGKISNLENDTYVIIRKSGAYFGEVPDEVYTNAEVRVQVMEDDELKDIIVFEANQKGTFLPPTGFIGKEGYRYHLNISIDGTEINAVTSMPDYVDVRNLYFEYHDENSAELIEGYYLYGTMDDPAGISNYYRVEFWQNGRPQKETAEQIFVFDDRVSDGIQNLNGMFGYWGVDEDDEPFPLLEGDTLILKVGSIDAEAYDFFKALGDTPFQGGLFGRNPANVPSNISGGLGCFYAGSFFQSQALIVPPIDQIRQ